VTVDAREAARDEPHAGRLERLLLLGAVLLWAALVLPLVLGAETFFARDVFTTHLHAKAFGARELAEGRVPYFRPGFGLGETFRGDPNYLPLYPGNALYLVLPFWSAFHLHYALHWLLAFFAMRRLAQVLRLRPEAALLAGLTYAGCGYGLTCLGFYNIVTVFAWWPLVIAGVVASTRGALVLGGLACGLAWLGGDPVSTALGVLPLALFAILRHGIRRGFSRAGGVLGLGLLLALPQVVATARVMGFSGRANLGVAAGEYALHPARLLELLVPLPFGDPFELGPGGFLVGRLATTTPFFYSLHVGVVGLLLALLGARAAWRSDRGAAARWARGAVAIAVGGLVLAWLGGPFGELLEAASAGLFRFPEKLLLWPALAVPLLAGRGLEAALFDGVSYRRVALVLALASGLVAALFATPALDAAYTALGATAQQVQELRRPLLIAAVLSALLLGLAALVPRLAPAHRAAALLGLQLLCLLRLAPLFATDDASAYRQPAPWAARLSSDAAVVAGGFEDALQVPPPIYRSTETSRRLMTRVGHLDLDFPTGTLQGFEYPLVHQAAGLGSPLLRVLRQSLPALDWPQRIGWLRALGVDFLTLPLPEGGGLPAELHAALEPLEVATHAGVPTLLARVPGAAPDAWWPKRVETSTSARQILAAVGDAASVEDVAWAPASIPHAPGATVEIVERAGDVVELQVRGGGGLLVVRRSFHPLLRATAPGERLQTMPVNLMLLGVVVPPGNAHVRIDVARWPDRLGWLGPLAVVGVVALQLTSASRTTRPL
jgi:hypothetical protein